jgi:hypothetical protein
MRLALFLSLIGVSGCLAAGSDDIVYPDKMKVRTIHDFGARGDGKHDDTEALVKAMNTSGHTYFPNGTYLVTDSVVMTHKPWVGPTWQGQSRRGVVIKLAEDAKGFANPDKPKPVLAFFRMKGHSADMFKFNCADMTVDTGAHKGAIAVRFHSNNNGMLRNVHIRGEGAIGLDLSSGHNGPLLCKDIRIEGFDVGINGGSGPYNSQTVDGLVLRGQRKWGIYNDREALFIRDVDFEGACPAAYLHANSTLVDARLKGQDVDAPALTVLNNVFLRNIEIDGFASGARIGRSYRDKRKRLRFTYEKELLPPADIDELAMGDDIATTAPTGRPVSLGLDVPDYTFPAWPADPDAWVLVDDHGAVPDDDQDDSAAIQKAIDHAAEKGLSTVCFRANCTYILDNDVRVHGSVRRLQGAASYFKTSESKDLKGFIIARQDGPAVSIEGCDRPLGRYFIQVRHEGGRDLYVRRLRGRLFADGPGNVFLIDAMGQVRINHPKAAVYAWQLNTESGSETNVVNDGGTLWVLGLKTERNQIYIDTRNGGRTELLGAWLYNTLNSDPAPYMFSAIDSELSIAGAVYYNYWGRTFPQTVCVVKDGKGMSLGPKQLPPSVTLFSTQSK